MCYNDDMLCQTKPLSNKPTNGVIAGGKQVTVDISLALYAPYSVIFFITIPSTPNIVFAYILLLGIYDGEQMRKTCRIRIVIGAAFGPYTIYYIPRPNGRIILLDSQSCAIR